MPWPRPLCTHQRKETKGADGAVGLALRHANRLLNLVELRVLGQLLVDLSDKVLCLLLELLELGRHGGGGVCVCVCVQGAVARIREL